MIDRRTMLAGLWALTATSGAFAQQQPKIWRVGFLAQPSRPPDLESSRYGAFPRAMRELGYIEGENLVIEWRFADGSAERLPGLAEDLVKRRVDIIVAAATPAISAAQKASATIPIVMGTVNDPVGSGFVESLARPGGNITGLSNLSTDISPKLLELLLGIAPKTSLVAILVNPTNASHRSILKSLQAATERIGAHSLPVEAASAEEIKEAFAIMNQRNAGAAVVAADPLFFQQRQQIADLAIEHRMASAFAFREHVEAGGLMSYGQNLAHNYWRAAAFVDKIFKGSKPGDLPVEQSTKLELFINRRTADALGLSIPAHLLVLAKEVIE
jgi:putative ABC transport system substrate-binding protein